MFVFFLFYYGLVKIQNKRVTTIHILAATRSTKSILNGTEEKKENNKPCMYIYIHTQTFIVFSKTLYKRTRVSFNYKLYNIGWCITKVYNTHLGSRH